MEDFGIETKRFYDENGDARPIGNFQFFAPWATVILACLDSALPATRRTAAGLCGALLPQCTRKRQETSATVECRLGQCGAGHRRGKTIGAYDIAADGDGNLLLWQQP